MNTSLRWFSMMKKKTTMKMLPVIVLHKGEGTTQLNLEEESMRGTWKVCRLKTQ